MGLLSPRRPPRHAVTAASTAATGTLRKSGQHDGNVHAQAWQMDSWAYFDSLGPIKYAANFQGNMLARVRLFAAVTPDDGDDPVAIEQILDPKHDAKAPAGIPDDLMRQAIVELARIRSDTEGQAAIQKDLGLNRFVAGEGFLTVVPHPELPAGETWQVYSVGELVRRGKTKDGQPKWGLVGRSEPLPDDTKVFRIYNPHPFRRNLADAPMRGVLDDCEQLALINAMFRSVTRSRLPQAGILTLPTELSFSTDNEDEQNPFIRDLVKHLTTPITDPNSVANVVPHFLEGPNDYLGPNSVRIISFERPVDPLLAAQQKEKLSAIAIGIDLPPEVILGVAEVNHWTAFQVSEETWKAHGEPLTISIAGQIGAIVLRELLTAHNKWTPQQIGRVVVGYDPSNLIDHPDRAGDALKVHAVFGISDAALRQYTNFAEEDAPTPEEISERVERERLIHARGALPQVIPSEDVAGPGTTPQKPIGPPPKGPQPADQVPGPATSQAPQQAPSRAASAMVAAAGRPVGHRLADLDLALYARVHGMCQTAVRRQLEKAGAQITSKAQRNKPVLEQAKAAPKHAVAASLGRSLVADLGLVDDQLTGDFTDLLDQVDVQVDRTRKAGLAALLAFLAGHGQQPDPAQLIEYDMATQRAQQDGRLRLQEGLSAFVLDQLYDPDPQADDRGEGVEAGDVPPGLVRSALAVYGGQDVNELGQSADDTPTRGVAGGSDNLTVGASLGIVTDTWEWVHGAAIHPFPPHLDLDGQIFSDSDSSDTRRANTEDAWLGQPDYQINDHAGCTCYALPLLDYSGSGDAA